MKTGKINEYQSGTRTQRLEGLLIKKRDFGEGHTFFTILDQDIGKTEFGGFGVRNLKSRRRNALLIGNLISAVIYRKSENSSASLKEAYLIQTFPYIRSNLRHMAYFYLILEVIDILLAGEQPFTEYSLLMETINKMNSEKRIEKYVLFLIFKILRNEGIFPEYSGELIKEMFHFTDDQFKLGNGSMRFLKDTENIEHISFWDSREISQSVIINLLELLSQSIKFHFNRNIKSLSLINFNKNL